MSGVSVRNWAARKKLIIEGAVMAPLTNMRMLDGKWPVIWAEKRQPALFQDKHIAG